MATRPPLSTPITALTLLFTAALATPARTLAAFIAAKRAQARAQPDGGYFTETAVVTALLVAAAIVVLAIITAKVIAKAKSINL